MVEFTTTIRKGTLTLSLKKNDMILIEKVDRKDKSQYRNIFVSAEN